MDTIQTNQFFKKKKPQLTIRLLKRDIIEESLTTTQASNIDHKMILKNMQRVPNSTPPIPQKVTLDQNLLKRQVIKEISKNINKVITKIVKNTLKIATL